MGGELSETGWGGLYMETAIRSSLQFANLLLRHQFRQIKTKLTSLAYQRQNHP